MPKIIWSLIAIACVGAGLYYVIFIYGRDKCEFGGWKRTIGVEASSTTEGIQKFQGALNISAGQMKEFDILLNDYAAKFETICRDFKMGTIKPDEYNCRRDNMEKALNNVRALNSSLEALGKGYTGNTQKEAAQTALQTFASIARSSYAEGCGSKMSVSPLKIDFGASTLERSIRITNSGNRDFRYSIGELPDSFVPVPSSGNISNGEVVSVAIIRTNRPAQTSKFSVNNNFNNTISVDIGIDSDANPYKKVVLSNPIRGSKETLSKALDLADEYSPDTKNNPAARHMIAGNILQNAGDTANALYAYETAESLAPMGGDPRKFVRSPIDAEIEKNFRAALAAKGLADPNIKYKAKGGVLIVAGTVRTREERDALVKAGNGIGDEGRVVFHIDFHF